MQRPQGPVEGVAGEGLVLLTFGFFLTGEARNTRCLLVKAANHGDALLSQKLLPFI
jgi:hypothetical protein